MIKTPLRYPGGKSRAVKFIAKFIPDFKEYREPFLGGGSLFIYLKQKYPYRKFWINDIYEDLFMFWFQLQRNPDKLIKQIQYFKDGFTDGRLLYKYLVENKDNFNPIQRASAFFVLNRITFSGTTESGGFSYAAFKARFTQSSINRLKLVSELLNDVKITNLDYQKVVEEDGEDVFIFLDPPYYSSSKSALYGKNGQLHKMFDHERFASVMKNVKHKWLITYDNSERIRELFSFAYIMEWNLVYGMKNVGRMKSQIGCELLISNYPLVKY